MIDEVNATFLKGITDVKEKRKTENGKFITLRREGSNGLRQNIKYGPKHTDDETDRQQRSRKATMIKEVGGKSWHEYELERSGQERGVEE